MRPDMAALLRMLWECAWTPRSLVRQEAEAAKQREREKSGLTTAHERSQRQAERESQADRRHAYGDSLDADQEAILLEEARAALLATAFWRDYVRDKGTGTRSYEQALKGEWDKIVDVRLAQEGKQ